MSRSYKVFEDSEHADWWFRDNCDLCIKKDSCKIRSALGSEKDWEVQEELADRMGYNRGDPADMYWDCPELDPVDE